MKWMVGVILLQACGPSGVPLAPQRPGVAAGPLRVLAANPRYFTDDGRRAVLLTGSHTWSSLQDNGPTDPPPPFDYTAYLDTLAAHNHDFFRLYSWEQSRWTSETAGDYWITPLPWQRTGPGLALDGKPRFDLTRFNPAYFSRLRARVAEAGRRGIYVSVMLFNGWSVEPKGDEPKNDPWRGHPFNAANNINGIDGHLDPLPAGRATHTLLLPRVLALQEAYVRQVVEAVGDFDNVLYEISNESDAQSVEWQYHMIRYVKTCEAGRPKQHPVGMTVPWPGGSNGALFASPADWISPNDSGGYFTDPPPADGSKVIIVDTDHLGTERTQPGWIWKAFLRGLNPIFMDTYDGRATGLGAGPDFDPSDPRYVRIRAYMGYALTYATRINLADLTPQGEITSTGYALATEPGHRGAPLLLTYTPAETLTVDLRDRRGRFALEWFSPSRDAIVPGDTVNAGARIRLEAPFHGEAVLFLRGLDSGPD